MLKLLKHYLGLYQLDMSPIAAPLIFLCVLFVIRFVILSLATSQMKNIPSDYRKELKKHFRERSLIGWLFFLALWAMLILAYFEILPQPFSEEVYLWSIAGILFLISISCHFLGLAQAAIQTIAERKSISLVG